MAGLMTLREVADYLRVTTKTVSRLLKTGGIPATKVGRQWRFDKDILEAWLQKRPSSQSVAILVVDDEESIRMLFKEILEEMGHRVILAGTATEALAAMQQDNIELVFLDLKMPGMDGARLFRRIKNLQHKLTVIIITGYPDSEVMVRAMNCGPLGIMNKPFGESDIITAVNSFIRIKN